MPPIRQSQKSHPQTLSSLLQSAYQGYVSIPQMTSRELQAEARNSLNDQYRRLLRKENVSVPWTWPWEAVSADRVILIGYPLDEKLADPGSLTKDKLILLVAALRRGTCYFAKISEAAFQALEAEYAKGVNLGGIIPKPPRDDRSDKGSVHGRHKNPATQTKKRRRGKIINSPPIVRDDTDIEDFSEGETQELSSDPIVDWSD
ncbi:hypothetical protein QCA50_013573 [Cerrena zonata]|uniref:Uncharacterized protein n=1 Tax=Cerrena zonata TaxID=2478898 RepID=A0AAW0G101_9APHY